MNCSLVYYNCTWRYSDVTKKYDIVQYGKTLQRFFMFFSRIWFLVYVSQHDRPGFYVPWKLDAWTSMILLYLNEFEKICLYFFCDRSELSVCSLCYFHSCAGKIRVEIFIRRSFKSMFTSWSKIQMCFRLLHGSFSWLTSLVTTCRSDVHEDHQHPVWPIFKFDTSPSNELKCLDFLCTMYM